MNAIFTVVRTTETVRVYTDGKLTYISMYSRDTDTALIGRMLNYDADATEMEEEMYLREHGHLELEA